jgi:hypothetical protein
MFPCGLTLTTQQGSITKETTPWSYLTRGILPSRVKILRE